MTDPEIFRMTLVAGDHVLEFSVDSADVPRSLGVELTVDGSRLRGWEEPGWRQLGFGVANGEPFWWSARRLVLLDLRSVATTNEVELDEDIVCVLGLRPGTWFIAAETSARLVNEGVESSRIDFDDVVVRCAGRRGVVIVTLIDGREWRLSTESNGLRVLDP